MTERIGGVDATKPQPASPASRARDPGSNSKPGQDRRPQPPREREADDDPPVHVDEYA